MGNLKEQLKPLLTMTSLLEYFNFDKKIVHKIFK